MYTSREANVINNYFFSEFQVISLQHHECMWASMHETLGYTPTTSGREETDTKRGTICLVRLSQSLILLLNY